MKPYVEEGTVFFVARTASKKTTSKLTTDEYNTLNFLAKNRDIIIIKAGNGNAIVIQNKFDYENKFIER